MIAEPRLPVPGEDLWNLHSRPFHHHGVGVDELEAEALRDEPSDGRLATTHEADEDDIVAHCARIFAQSDGGAKDDIFARRFKRRYR